MGQGFTRLGLSRAEVMNDYRVALTSRFASLIGRKEVLNGRAKFGIFGDGKEVAQVAMARSVRKGDWRSGYYRDQTLFFALGACNLEQFFAQLYADTAIEREPSSGGRQMNCHFATRLIDDSGNWRNHLSQFNTSSDISPTAGQMSRLVGLAYASKLFRQRMVTNEWSKTRQLSNNGSEVAFGTIGNASTSEGLFWEALNAAGVLQVPFLISIWDDGYGISVPNDIQTTKGSIFDILQGFASSADKNGYALFQAKGHDYVELVNTYDDATQLCREHHRPTVVHVNDMTQPQGHSTSGSHERYKSPERLAFEQEMDCLTTMAQWMVGENIATMDELEALQADVEMEVVKAQQTAWNCYQADLEEQKKRIIEIYQTLDAQLSEPVVAKAAVDLQKTTQVFKRTLDQSMTRTLLKMAHIPYEAKSLLCDHLKAFKNERYREYNSALFCHPDHSPLIVKNVAPHYSSTSRTVDGRQVIQHYFHQKLAADPRIFIIGEDVGKLGGVNLEFEGLSETYGDLAVTDTGIREATILGQGIGAALRGLRPIVDIQYLDYLAYCLQGLTDDLATLSYRTAGGQVAPVIVRTKGHRLEGIWHTGSPMAMILGAVRGLHVCVPRDSVQAAGMYETLLQGDDPALVIEVLSGYRIKERLPDNLGTYTVPLGVPEVLHEGTDLTIVTYGANCRIALGALSFLAEIGIDPEVIDVQTLLPFDDPGVIAKSLAKTNALLVFDEDVPGGASAYIVQKILEVQGGYNLLDAPPRTLTAQEHRAAYGSDGDYYCKPSQDDLILAAYQLMRERFPQRFLEVL